jgi:hypothetical protein
VPLESVPQVDSFNPYQVSNQSPGDINPNGLRRSILTQIRIISILMIIHGLLLMAVGGLYLFFAMFMPSFVIGQNKQIQQPGGPSPEDLEMILLVTYAGMSAAGILPGILQVIAGIANVRLKGRIFGMIALGCGVLSVGTCYCAPTGIALCIYGLIIYFHDTASKAFELSSKGMSYSDIERQAQ